jgi:hypothetical protein
MIEREDGMQIKLENAPVFSINGEGQPPLDALDAPVQATEAETAPVLRVRRSPHTQRVEYAELVATAGLALSSLANAEEPLRTLLEENGITASYIARCVAQRDGALATVESRQQAIAAEQQTTAAMNEAIERARWAVMALRQVARTMRRCWRRRRLLRHGSPRSRWRSMGWRRRLWRDVRRSSGRSMRRRCEMARWPGCDRVCIR